MSEPTRVTHSITVIAAPDLTAAPVGILVAGDLVERGQERDGFVAVALRDGRRGYLPAEALPPLASGSEAAPATTKVTQPVALYRSAQAGQQYASVDPASAEYWIVRPDEDLLLIGLSDRFALIQRESGRVGYVPRLLCVGVPPPVRVDGIVLATGFLWCGVQYAVLSTLVDLLMEQLGVAGLGLAAVRVAVAGALLAALLHLSPWRVAARSLAIGALISIALTEISSLV